VYAANNQLPEAEADFRKAITLDPKNLEGYANLSRYYQFKNEPEKAIEVLQLGIKNNPDAAANYLRLAALYYAMNRKNDSEAVIQQLRNTKPSSGDIAGEIAAFYLAERNPEAAIREYNRGLSVDPKNDKLKTALVEIDMMSGHVDEAQKLNDEILKEKPNDVAARMAQARMLAAKGKYTEAISIFRGVLKDAPENSRAHYYLAQALRQTGDMAGAKAEFQEAVKREPDNPLFLEALAETYRDSRDLETAKEYGNRLLKVSPNSPQAHLTMATIDLGLRDFKDADEQLAQASKLAPNDPAIHLNMAFSYGGQKKFAEAEREFQTALKLNPQYDAAATEYVAMLYATNQAQKGLEFATRYAAANPNRAPAHFIYATALANSKNFDQSIAEFQKCIELDPKAGMPYLQLGRIYMVQNKPDQAIAIYQKALSVQPNSPGINMALGNIYLYQNNLAQARQYFEKANQLAPNDPLAANDLAWVYALQGQNLDVALNLAQQAKQALPNVPAVTDTLAWVQYKKGNYAIAVSLLDEAVKKAPQSAQYRYHLGMALNATGDHVRAKEELKKSLELNLRGDDAQQAQQALAKL